MSNNTAYKGNAFSPLDFANAGLDAIKRNAEYKDRGIPLSVSGSGLDDYFAPLMPWEICAIQAQTHNGKTMFADWWERKTVEYMNEHEIEGSVVHVSLEESIEAMAFTEYGRLLDVLPAKLARGEYADMDKLMVAWTQIGQSKIWRIAESAKSPDAELMGDDAPQAELTLSNIYRACKAIQDGAISSPTKIRLIVVDYLQALPIDAEVKRVAADARRRLQVRNDVYRLRKMTVHLESPILVPVQAKQQLEGANPPYLIPGMYDGEETASIAQRFDRIISLWMPKTSHPVGTTVYHNGEPAFKVAEDMVFMKVNKQRGGLPSGKTFELKVDYKKREYLSAYGKPVGDKDV